MLQALNPYRKGLVLGLMSSEEIEFLENQRSILVFTDQGKWVKDEQPTFENNRAYWYIDRRTIKGKDLIGSLCRFWNDECKDDEDDPRTIIGICEDYLTTYLDDIEIGYPYCMRNGKENYQNAELLSESEYKFYTVI